ncbi:MAG TPA: hypothetical protein VMW10_11985, partial [Alphaproteobacteria bacterium]|nr:hypothetical protein [Alphaproteobacteria bacterium]
MPVTKVGSRWSSGNLIFFEKSIGPAVIGNLLTIGTTAVTVGSATQDADFKVFLGSANEYFLCDVGGSKVTLVGDL